MKPDFLVLLIVALVAGLAGAGIMQVCRLAQATRHDSSVGQTLVDLSRALESEKERTGKYPDSVVHLKVEGSGGDFSSKILKEIIYFKTDSGFVAFAGRPHVAYIHPGVSTQYQ